MSLNHSENILFNLLIGFLFSFIISSISYRFKLLNFSGSIATFFLAQIIFTFGGWQWTFPIVTFFVLSSFLSKFRKRKNLEVEKYFDKSDQRDYLQVTANGGLGALLVTLNYFYPSELLYVIYVSAVAAVCADTWATEIGTLFKTKTIDIYPLKKLTREFPGVFHYRECLLHFLVLL